MGLPRISHRTSNSLTSLPTEAPLPNGHKTLPVLAVSMMNFETTRLADWSCGGIRHILESLSLAKLESQIRPKCLFCSGVLLLMIFHLFVRKCSSSGLRNSERVSPVSCLCTRCALSDGNLSQCVSEDTGKATNLKDPQSRSWHFGQFGAVSLENSLLCGRRVKGQPPAMLEMPFLNNVLWQCQVDKATERFGVHDLSYVQVRCFYPKGNQKLLGGTTTRSKHDLKSTRQLLASVQRKRFYS